MTSRRIRTRSIKQHQITLSALDSESDADKVILVLTNRQWGLIKSLIAFYSEWRTQYAYEQYANNLYAEITDDEYFAILDLIARIPESELTMSEITEKLDEISLLIASLCDCIYQKITQHNSEMPELPEGYEANVGEQDGDFEMPEYDVDKCVFAQKVHAEAKFLLDVVFEKLMLGYTASGIFDAIVLALGAASILPPAWVLGAIFAALVMLAFIVNTIVESDIEAFADTQKQEFVCAVYSADTLLDAQKNAEDIINASGYNSFQKTLLKLVYSPFVMSLINANVWKTEDRDLDGYACTYCGIGLSLFHWKSETGTQPFTSGVYQQILGLDNVYTPPSNWTDVCAISVPKGTNLKITMICGVGASNAISFGLGDTSAMKQLAITQGTASAWYESINTVTVGDDMTRLWSDRGNFSSAYCRELKIEAI